MIISTAITATKRYLHAADILTRRIKANMQDQRQHEHHLILVTDESEEAKDASKRLQEACSKLAEVHIIPMNLDDEVVPYKESAQLMIAQMEVAAFEKARDLDSDFFWSVEPDVLPPANAMRCLLDTLHFDNGYYDIAMVTYPSQGGGAFLGGRGTPERWILPDIYEDERDLPQDIIDRRDKLEKRIQKNGGKPSKAAQKEAHTLHEKIQQCPPKEHNIFAMQAKHWRRRGWLNNAYPGLGKGCVLPTDWVGMGCTMLSRKALASAHFEGYKGAGTQDLFLTWKRWHPEGMKRAVITHIACEHIIRANRDKEKGDDYSEFLLCCPDYETEGEHQGHLRMRVEPYYKFSAGEQPVQNSTT